MAASYPTTTVKTTGWPAIDDLAVKLSERRAEVEREVLAMILADHQRLLAITDEAGLCQHDFSEADHRAIYIAIVVGRECALNGVLSLAAAALRRWHMWNDRQPAGSRGLIWSWPMLVELAGEQPGNATILNATIRRLRRIDDRQRLARKHLRDAADLLVDDDIRPISSSGRFNIGPRVLMAVPKIRMRGAA